LFKKVSVKTYFVQKGEFPVKQVVLKTREKAALLDMIWNRSLHQMIMAQMLYNENGTFADWLVLNVDPSFERCQGITKDEIVNQRLSVFFPSYDPSWLGICDKALRSGIAVKTESYLAPLDKWYEGCFVPLGSEDKFIIILRDITARKQNEQALLETEQGFRLLIDTAVQAIWESDEKGWTDTDSPSWRAFTGQTLEEWFGYGWANAIHPDDLAIAKRECQEAREAGRNIDVEVRIKSHDGSWRWCNLLATPIRDKKGRIVKWVGMSIDISGRKEAEEAVSAVRMTDFSLEDRSSILEDETYGSIHPGDYEIVSDWHRRLPACMDTVSNFEYSLKVKSGKHSLFRNGGQVVHNGKGQPVAVVGINRDVTEKTTGLQALMEKEHRLENIVWERNRELDDINRTLIQTLESITDAFFTLDKQWRVTYWNRAAEEMFACPRHDILGNVLWEVFPEVLGSQHFPQLVQVMEEARQLSFVIQGIINTAKWFAISVYPSPSGLTIYAQDITEQKLAEEQLRESNDRFRKIFENSPVAMAIVRNADHRILDVNSYWEKFTGYSREEAIGKSSTELTLDEAQWSESIRELNSKGMLEGVEVQIRKKSGEISDFEGAVALVQFNGEQCRLIVGKDITKEKQFKSELSRLERLNMVGQMAVSIGHELRNPMTVVRGFLQMMSQKEKYNEDRHHLLLMIDELDRANSIISGFLSLANNKAINMIPTDLNSIIENLLPLIKTDAAPNGIAVITVMADIPHVLLDHNEIRQLILNFTRNACEAMPSGGVLRIGTSVDNDEVVLEIQDQGTGIPPEILEVIGTPFISTKENGTGLGLAVCYSIANRLDARIEIDTGIEGTTVRIKFKPYI